MRSFFIILFVVHIILAVDCYEISRQDNTFVKRLMKFGGEPRLLLVENGMLPLRERRDGEVR